jgi:hypothetical protein
MTKRITYKATLCNSAGELDFISAADLETLTRHLGKKLVAREWTLAEGDTIIIVEVVR